MYVETITLRFENYELDADQLLDMLPTDAIYMEKLVFRKEVKTNNNINGRW